jgi:hypothetical protein
MNYKLNRLLSKRHTGLSKGLVLLTALFIVSGLLTACKAAPESPPVIGKQSGIDSKIADNTQGLDQLSDVPKTLSKTITSGKLTVNVDAKLQIPSTSKMPTIEVAPAQLTSDVADKFVKLFIGDATLYETTHLLTKNEIKKEIERQHILAINGLNDQTNSGGRQSNADVLKQSLDSAPESVQLETSSRHLEDVNESDITGEDGKVLYPGFKGKSLVADADLGKGFYSNLSIVSSASAKDCYIKFINHDITSIYRYSEFTEQPARGMKSTLEDANKLADSTLNTLGITDLKLAGIQLATLLPSTEKEDPDAMNQAYGLWFTRDVSEFPTTLDTTDSKSTDDNFTESYPYERVFMLIDDSGILEFSWTSPMSVKSTVSSDTKILPFKNIMKRFEQQFPTRYALSDAKIQSSAYNISRITLGLMRLQVKDSTSEYMMVPVWDFFGTLEQKGDSGTTVSDHTLQSFLTINAIDGSVIDRTLGY